MSPGARAAWSAAARGSDGAISRVSSIAMLTSCVAAMILGATSTRMASSLGPLTVRRVARRVSTVRASDSDFDSYTAACPFLFPGQGAQAVGMAVETCASVPAAKALFEQASEVLGYDLLDKCANGPKESLDSTVVSQPAIFVASLAAVEKLRAEGGDEAVMKADVAAGLSLGEYTALAFAGAFSFEDGVKIVKARGEAMQAAADATKSGMVSVIGLDKEKVAALCAMAAEQSGEKIQLANLLCNGNYAVSGALAACEKVAELAKPEFKARMTVPLAVAGAFHTDFMAPAVPTLVEVLEGVTISKPRIPVISNVDAAPHSDPAVIKQLLAKQVTSPVQWETTVAMLLERGMKSGYELGPGKVLAGILKRIDKTVEITNIEV